MAAPRNRATRNSKLGEGLSTNQTKSRNDKSNETTKSSKRKRVDEEIEDPGEFDVEDAIEKLLTTPQSKLTKIELNVGVTTTTFLAVFTLINVLRNLSTMIHGTPYPSKPGEDSACFYRGATSSLLRQK